MDLPTIADGTVTLRPFHREDSDAAVAWLSGPESRSRSQTDGGPSTDDGTARSLVDDLRHSSAYTVLVDDVPRGWVKLRTDSQDRGHLQLVLAEPGLWNQGIGARAALLVCRAAFEHLGLTSLQVDHLREDAHPACITWENVGFGITRRYIEDNRVFLDLVLTAVSHRSKEQRVFLINHGRTAPEHDGRLLGASIDSPLDAVGRAQAEALSLSDLLLQINEGISSPLKRARATAERALASRDIACTIEKAWRDRDWGDWSGQPVAGLPRTSDGRPADPPDGEDDTTFTARCLRALETLPHGENLAIVTHGTVIAALIRDLWPAVTEAPGLRTGTGIRHGSITELRRGPQGWRLIRLSDDRHLQERKATTELA